MLGADTVSDHVVAVSVSRYTSMVLTRRSQVSVYDTIRSSSYEAIVCVHAFQVYTCGTNKFRQLGHAADQVTKFKAVNLFVYHSLLGYVCVLLHLS